MNIAVILAGGVGSRVGARNEKGEAIPKQFVEVLGKPVLVYTLEKFQNHPDIDAIEVVCVSSHLAYLEELKETYGLNKIRWITEGGETFQDSVYRGIRGLEQEASRSDTVLVHFGASPFIEDYIITDAIEVCKTHSNAISSTDYFLLCGLKHKLTSVDDPDNYTAQYVDRDTIACMSTPHAFRYGFVCDLYQEAIETGAIHEVEPHTTTLMYRLGKPIYFSKGSQTNIKITKKEDLDLFEGYVLMKQKRAKEAAD